MQRKLRVESSVWQWQARKCTEQGLLHKAVSVVVHEAVHASSDLPALLSAQTVKASIEALQKENQDAWKPPF